MALAYVLITSEISAEDEVLNEVRSVPEVKEVHVVYGIYDLIALLEAESIDKIKEVVTQKIRGVKRVRSTLTMIVAES